MDNKTNYRIGVEYTLYTKNDGKETIEEQTREGEPFRFLSGFGMCLDAFEAKVAGLEIGDTFDFTLPVEEAYGPYDERGLLELDKDMFVINGRFDSEHITEGNVIQLQNADGQRFPALVVSVGDKVKVDLNHPLAGRELHFVGKVTEKIEASAQEIQAMMAHLAGEGGGCGGNCGNCGGGCNGGCNGCSPS